MGTWGDRWAMWRSRHASTASLLHPLPPLPLTGDPRRAEAMLAAGQPPDDPTFGWLNDLAALGDERAGRFAAQAVADWAARPQVWSAGATGWRLLHWLAHARFIHPRGVPQHVFASLSRQAEFLRHRLPATGPDRLAALAGSGAAAHALDARFRPTASLPPLPQDLTAALVLLIALRATTDLPVGPMIAQAATTLRGLRHADGRLTRLRGGDGGDPVLMDAVLAAAGVRPTAEATGFARRVRGRTTLIVDLTAPLAFELTAGRYPVVIATPEGRAGASIPERRLRPAAVVTTGDALSVVATHEGWRGLMHHRSLTLAPDGRTLHGREELLPHRRARPLGFDLHFPLPDDIAATVQDDGVALTLPDGTRWTFAAPGATLASHPRRIAVSRWIDTFPARIDWTFAASGANPVAIQPAGASL